MTPGRLLIEYSLDEALDRLHRARRRKGRSKDPLDYSRSMHLLDRISLEGGASSGELARQMDVRPATLSEMLDKLQGEGFVRRVKDGSDQRIIRIEITPEGQTRLDLVKEKKSDRYEDILSNDEYESFIALCLKLRRGLDERRKGGE